MGNGLRPVANAQAARSSQENSSQEAGSGSGQRIERDASRKRQQDEAAPGNREQEHDLECDNAPGNREQEYDPEYSREEVKFKMARNPGNPTREEVERHNMTHLPFRAWCPVCVEAKGKEDSHYKANEKGDKPKVGLDYKAFGQEKEGDDKTTMIVGRDRDTKMTFCHVCTSKGPGDEWVVGQLVDDIDRPGHTEMIMKTDGEPAIVALMEAIK